MVFDPRDNTTWTTTALVKAHQISTCFIKDPKTNLVYLGSPRIIARTENINRPVYFKQFINPEKALDKCPIPYVMPLTVMIREALKPNQADGLFDGLMAAADNILSDPNNTLTTFPGWQMMQR